MIITSILDLDLYKLTVGQVIFSNFRNVKAKYRMTVRNGTKIDYWKYVPIRDLDKEIKSLGDLSLTAAEAAYLRSLGFFTKEYIQFLMDKPMNPSKEITWAYQDGTPNTPVPEASGEWCRVMLYEIFCLSIGDELFARNYAEVNSIDMSHVEHTARMRLAKKIERLVAYNSYQEEKLIITEFGTRRRLSKKWQNEVIRSLNTANLINGTSNVYAAMTLGIPCRGTFGHEFTMGMQGIFPVQTSQAEAFKLWLSFWKGKLKIALDDTLGTKKFFRDFTRNLANEYDGLRHDSGDPMQWAHERLRMYFDFGIDPRTKTLFFSDGLNIEKAINIHTNLCHQTKLGFGIGTDLTNDSFIPVPQVVMKIVLCNEQFVCKLSNNPEKACCDNPAYLEYVKDLSK